MADLKELIRKQIVDIVIRGVQTESGWKVLIVDAVALRMISACCTMTDMTDNDVTIVEDLSKTRQPHPEMDAIYLCYPAVVNAKAIEQDFTPTPKYKTAHIYFIDTAEDVIISTIAKSALLKPRVRSLVEMNMNFIPREDRVFTLDEPAGLRQFYSPASHHTGARDVAVHIASVCGALGEVPIVRYTASSKKCADLAKFTHERIQALAMTDDGMKAKKSQLLIIDRGEDLASVLVHELTYQAAVYDLLGSRLKGDLVEYSYEDAKGNQRTQQRVLGSDDKIWEALRHSHVDVVGSKVSAMLKEFQAENAALAIKEKGSQEALAEMMRRAPQKQAKTALFSLHINLVAEIVDVAFRPFEAALVETEQNVLNGTDKHGDRVKDIIAEVVKFMEQQEKGGTSEDKVRALLLALVANGGLHKEDLDHLCAVGKLDAFRKTIENFQHFGAAVGYEGPKRKHDAPPRSDAGNPELTKYFTSRWTPIAKSFMLDAVNGKLSPQEYPAVAGDIPNSMLPPKPTRAATSSRWAAVEEEDDEEEEGNKLIVFIPGVVGYNEIRCCHEISEQFGIDVYLGSHSVATPKEFLERVATF